MELYNLTISEARSAIDKGEISPTELTNAVFNRIEAVEKKIKAYVTLLRENALTQAKQAEERMKSGLKQALLGIPIAIKDNMCTEGIRTTCSSKILECPLCGTGPTCSNPMPTFSSSR